MSGNGRQAVESALLAWPKHRVDCLKVNLKAEATVQ